MSATACVSAAEPERQHQMVSWTCVSLSVTRFAMYAPLVVRLSAPNITPSLKLIAMLYYVLEGDIDERRFGDKHGCS